MARRITAFLISIVLVFSLAVISFAEQSPAVYDLSSSLYTFYRYDDGTTKQIFSGDLDLSFSNFYQASVNVSNYSSFTSSPDQFLTVTYSGYTDVGLAPFDVYFYLRRFDNSDPTRPGTVIYDPVTGYFSASYSSTDLMRVPQILFSRGATYQFSGCTFLSIRSCVVTVSDSELNTSFEPILAITANTDYSGTIDLPVVRNSKSQRFQPIFHNPLEKGVTYLVTLSLSSYPYDIASDNVSGLNKVFDDVLITGVFNGGLGNTPGYAIPFTSSVVFPSFTDNLTSSGQHAWPFNTATQTVSFFYTPTANDSDPFYFSVTHNNQVKETFSALFNVQALPVVGVQLDDVQENQSFAAWLNNKLDSLFGGLFGRLQSNFNSEDQAYEDAADDAVDEGIGQVEQEHQREEELTQEAISNLDEALNAVELPDLTQQQEINSGIGLLNTVIFDGFFGNPQMRFLLIFSLGMALAAVVLRLNH